MNIAKTLLSYIFKKDKTPVSISVLAATNISECIANGHAQEMTSIEINSKIVDGIKKINNTFQRSRILTNAYIASVKKNPNSYSEIILSKTVNTSKNPFKNTIVEMNPYVRLRAKARSKNVLSLQARIVVPEKISSSMDEKKLKEYARLLVSKM